MNLTDRLRLRMRIGNIVMTIGLVGFGLVFLGWLFIVYGPLDWLVRLFLNRN